MNKQNKVSQFLRRNKTGIALGLLGASQGVAMADGPDAFATITTVETAALTLIAVVITTGVIRIGWRIAKRYISGL